MSISKKKVNEDLDDLTEYFKKSIEKNNTFYETIANISTIMPVAHGLIEGIEEFSDDAMEPIEKAPFEKLRANAIYIRLHSFLENEFKNPCFRVEIRPIYTDENRAIGYSIELSQHDEYRPYKVPLLESLDSICDKIGFSKSTFFKCIECTTSPESPPKKKGVVLSRDMRVPLKLKRGGFGK